MAGQYFARETGVTRASARYFFAALLLSVSALVITDHAAAQTTTVEFNIPAQTVPGALREFARQANSQLLFISEGFENIQANAVVGTFARQEALDRLLTGTGLQASLSSDSSIKVTPARESDVSVQPVGSVVSSEALSGLAAQAATQTDERMEDTGTVRAGKGSESETTGAAVKEMEEILVTGSRIRGASQASPTITLSREYIDLAGFSTVQQIIQSLPQNYSGGPNEDTLGSGEEAANIASGSGINLRGLGSGSTLVLINGRRQASSGRIGSFVDVSAVPVTAIDRVEVLTDGASAIYGADAVGGVVNIVLLKDYQGAETRFRYGPDIGNDYDEFQLGQVYGTAWSTGRFLGSYEFNSRGALAANDRPYINSDLTRFGGDDFREDRSQPGNVVSPATGGLLAIPTGQDGSALTFEDLLTTGANLRNRFDGAEVLADQEQHSVFLTFAQEIGEQFEVFADMRYRKREFDRVSPARTNTLRVPISNAFVDQEFLDAVNGVPGTSSVLVEYSFEDDLGNLITEGDAVTTEGVFGTTISLGESWQVELAGSLTVEENDTIVLNELNSVALRAALADTDFSTAFNPFGDGSNSNPATVESIRTTLGSDMDYDVTSYTVHADGPLMSLPGGALKLAVGGDYREEEFRLRLMDPARDLSRSNRDISRDVTAVFAEFFIPFIGRDNTKQFARRFELSIAARYEDYSDFGTTTNPKFGVLWAPTDSITVRSTFGTSFRAPQLEEKRSSDLAVISNRINPASPSGITRTLVQAGNDPDLKEETADIWNLGFEIRPAAWEQLSFTLNYFDIQYADRIARADSQNIFVQFDRFGEIVNLTPTQADLDAICLNPDIRLFADPTTCTTDIVGAIADTRLTNIAITDIQGLDFSVSYDLDTSIGDWSFGVDGTYYTNYDEAFSSTAPTFDLESTIGNPVDFRARARTSWSRDSFDVTAFVNYTDNYVDNLSTPARNIDSYTTVNLALSYRSDARRDHGNGWTAAVHIQNLFNEDPPFVNSSFGGYDRGNADPLRRQVVLQVSKEW